MVLNDLRNGWYMFPNIMVIAVNAFYNGVMDPADKRLQVGVAMNIPFGEKNTLSFDAMREQA